MTVFTVDPRQKKIVDINGRPIGLPINDFGSRTEIEFTGFTYSSSLSIALYLIRPDYRDGQTMPVYYGTTWTESNGVYKHEMKYGKDYYNSVTQNDSLARLVLVADSVVVLDQEVQIDMIFSYSEDAERLPEAGSGANYATEEYVNNAVSGKADESDLTAHTSDTTIHVTSTDKEAWNAKLDNPSGGTAGQVLTKTEDGEEWADSQGSEDNDYVNYFKIKSYIKGSASGSKTFRIDKVNHDETLNLQYSIDGGQTWLDYTWNGRTGQELNGSATAGVWMKGNNPSFNKSASHRFKIVLGSGTYRFDVLGNIMTLLDEYGKLNEVPDSCFAYMFQGCTNLYNVKDLILPAKYVGAGGYDHMFHGCSNLTTMPRIAATDFNKSACNGMFTECSNLTSAKISIPNIWKKTISDWNNRLAIE